MMLSTTFIGRLKKLYHTSPNILPGETKKKAKKNKDFLSKRKRNKYAGSKDQHLSNPLTLHTNLHLCKGLHPTCSNWNLQVSRQPAYPKTTPTSLSPVGPFSPVLRGHQVQHHLLPSVQPPLCSRLIPPLPHWMQN